MVARKAKIHRARVILRVAERNLAGVTPIMSRGDLEDHVYSVVLSRTRLLALMDEHDLYARKRAIGEDLALTAMRGDITVDVYRNYFLVADQERASARISLRFQSPDPDKAVAVVLDLAQSVIDYQAQRRQEAAAAAVRVTDEALERAKIELERREEYLEATEQRLGRTRDPETAGSLRVDISRLQSSVRAHRTLVEQARERKQAAQLALGAEKRRLAVAVEVAHVQRPPPPPKSRTRLFAMLGVVGFLFTLPLCAIAVGAFDSRVRDTEDVERIGVAALGHVPKFAGSGDGALVKRMRGARRTWVRRLLRRRR
jgi:hypothetical protein